MNFLPFCSAFLAQTLLRGSVWLLLIVLVACLLRRTSAARHAMVWQMSFAGLILLPVLLVFLPPLPLKQVDAPVPPVVVKAEPKPIIVPSHWQPAAALPSAPRTIRPQKTVPATPPVEPASTPVPPAVFEKPVPASAPAALLADMNALLFWGWSAGAAWLLLRLLFSLTLLRRLERSSVPVSPSLEAEAQKLIERLGLRGQVTLRSADTGSQLYAPVTWGLVRPVVMLPSACAEEAGSRRRAALLHELAHIRRGDWAWLLLAQIVCAFYWCVPFVWTAARRLRHEIELACDDCVLANGIAAPDYAAQILEVVRAMNTPRAHLPLSALTMARPPLAQTRIQAILAPHRRRQPVSRYALAFAALLPAFCVPLLSLRAVAAKDSNRKPSLSALPKTDLPGRSVSEITGSPALADVHAAQTKLTIPGSPLRSVPPDSEGAVKAPETVLPDGSIPLPQSGGDGIPFLKDLPFIGKLFVKSPAPAAEKAAEPPPAHEEKPGKRVPILGDMPLIGRLFQNDPAAGDIAWGKAQNDLQAGIRFRENRQRYFSGETLEVEYLIRNSGQKEIALDPATWKTPAAQFTITTQAKTTLLRGDSSAEHTLHAPVAALKPGDAVVVESFRLETSAQALTSPRLLLVAESGKFHLTQQKEIRLVGDGKATLTLQSGWTDFEIVSTATLARWGTAEDGLQAGLALSGNQQKFEIGNTVQMDLYWRNTSSKPVTVSYVAYNNYEYIADLETSSGTPVNIHHTFIDILPLSLSATIKPGGTLCVGHPRLLLVREKHQGIEAIGEVKPGWHRIRLESILPPFKPPYKQIKSDWVLFEVVENRPVEKPICWGEEVKGFQLGARITPERATFKVGDVIEFQAFGRNLSGEDLSLSVGNYWKVNYRVQVQTLDGNPIYMERNTRNQAMLVAGYRAESLGKGATQEISKAALKILREPQVPKPGTRFEDENTWVEAVPLKPGRYRVRLLSWGVFGHIKPEPASAWIPIEVKGE